MGVVFSFTTKTQQFSVVTINQSIFVRILIL